MGSELDLRQGPRTTLFHRGHFPASGPPQEPPLERAPETGEGETAGTRRHPKSKGEPDPAGQAPTLRDDWTSPWGDALAPINVSGVKWTSRASYRALREFRAWKR